MDFEVAESLLQHSRGGREGAEDTMPIATEPRPLSDYVPNFTSSSDGLQGVDGIYEDGQSDRQASSQEPQADAQYAPISIPPALGQVCR